MTAIEQAADALAQCHKWIEEAKPLLEKGGEAERELVKVREQLTHERQLRLAGEVAIARMRGALLLVDKEAVLLLREHGLTVEAAKLHEICFKALAAPPTNMLASVVEALQGAQVLAGIYFESQASDPFNNDNYCRLLDCLALLGVKSPSLNPPSRESSMHADSEIKRFCDGPS